MHSSFSAPDKLDLVFHDPTRDEFVLIMVHSGEWDGSADEESSLRQKLNSYAYFVLEGRLIQHFPEAEGKNVRLQIDGTSTPPNNIASLIQQANNRLSEHNLRVDFELVK
jgi:hypothetical protein